jgi:hypothetical protein
MFACDDLRDGTPGVVADQHHVVQFERSSSSIIDATPRIVSTASSCMASVWPPRGQVGAMHCCCAARGAQKVAATATTVRAATSAAGPSFA